MIKVLVADDEKLARDAVRYLLKNQKDVDVIADAENGQQVLDLYHQYQPDIVFLNIEMPGKTGLELAQMLSKTCIIFVSAYERYAINAFELNVVDYLLKPFDNERFYNAVVKARKKLQGDIDNNIKKIVHQLVDEQEKSYKSRLVLKDPGHIRLIDVDQVNYITGAGNYADVHLLEGNHYLHRETLTALEQQLDPKEFLRIHRSTIIRSSSVSELFTNDNGDYTVIIKTGEQLTLSRRNKCKLEQLIGIS